MKTEQESPTVPVSTSDTFFDREVGWLRMDRSSARPITFVVLSALAVYLVIVAAFACGPINVFHNDAFLLLDDGWRILNGQVPHRNFYTPLGPLEFFIVAGGMFLAKGSAQGLAIGFAIFGLGAAVWGFLLSRTRLPALFALFVTAWIVLTATSPTPLGFEPKYLSCAMIYNRQCYALLGIVLIECAIARQKGRFWGGLSSGVAIVLLAFLKLNFFGIAGVMLLASLALARKEFPRICGLLAGAVITVLAFLLYPHFSLSRFLADMSFAIHARGTSVTTGGLIRGTIACAKDQSVWIVLLMTVALIALTRPGQRWRRQTLTIVSFSLIVLLSGPIFLQTNTLENQCELAPLWIIILLERISALHLNAPDKRATVALIALGLGSLAPVTIPDVASLVNLLGYRTASRKGEGIRVLAPGVENMAFYDSTSFYDKVPAGDGDGTYYANCLNDGLTLLRSQSGSDETILPLGFHNPFSYLLRRRPAEGGSSYLLIGNSISPAHMPAVDQVFGNADLMILPDHEGTHRSSDLFIENYYRPYLSENFHFVARSRFWLLYRRNR